MKRVVPHSDTPEPKKRFIAVSGHTRLFRRGAVYYFRAKTPENIQAIIGKKEIRYSLKTADFSKAKRACSIASVKADSEFAKARAQLEAVAPVTSLSGDELFCLVSEWFIQTEREAETWAATEAAGYSEDERELVRDNLTTDLATYQDDTAQRRLNWTDKLAADFLKARPQLRIEKGSGDFKRLAALLRRAQVESLNRKVERLDGVVVKPTDPALAHLFAHSVPPSAPRKSITLKTLVDRFMKFQRENHSENTPAVYAIPTRILLEVLGGNTPIADITPGDIQRVAETIKTIPAFVAQRYPKQPLLKAISKADTDGNTERLRPATVEKYFNGVCAIFNFAEQENLIEASPTKGKKLASRYRVRRKKQRELFTMDELRAMFRAPLYTGCVDDESGFAKPGSNRPRRARFWVPLLALFHGSRLQELCQLYCEDVKEKDGVTYLAIRTELDDEDATDKRLKNQASMRDVPLHPELVKMGFLEFVKERKKDGPKARLFPELQLAKSTKRYSTIISRWFARFARRACGHKPKGVFHSFRYHFRTELAKAGVGIETAEILCGWTDGKRGMERQYFNPDLKTLSDAVAKVKYNGLDLTHLHTLPRARVRRRQESNNTM